MIWQIAWRNLMRRKRRTFLTLLAIIIGVASTFAVITAVDSTEKAFPIYLKEAFAKSDLVVYGTDSYFSEDVYEEARNIEGAVFTAALKQNTKLYIEDENIDAIQKRIVLTGYSDLTTDNTKFKVVKGDLTSGGAVITEQAANALKLDIGQPISIETDEGIKTIEVSAIVKYTIELMGPPNWGMAKYHHWAAAVPLDKVQEWFGLEGKVQAVQIKALKGTDLESLEQQVDALTKRHNDIYMQPITLDYSLDQQDTFFLALYLAGFLGIALSAFVIFNSLFVSVNERKKEFAALKTIGFTPEQLRQLVLFEVVLFSLIGTALGLVIGYGFAIVLKSIVFAMFGIYDQVVMELWKGLVVSVLAGLLVPIVAALYPIRQAGKVSVIQALQENNAAKRLDKKWLVIVGILLIGSSFFIKHLLLIVPLMAGVTLLYPYLFKAFGVPLKPVYKRLFGFSGEVAARSLERNLTRTSMTSLILSLGVSMIILMSSLNWAMIQSYERVIYSTYGGNLDIMFHHVEDGDLERLRSTAGVAEAETYALNSAIWDLNEQKRRLPIFGVEERWIDRFPLFTVSGMSDSELIKSLKNDEIALDKISFDVWGGQIGESISLQTLDGYRPFKVVAVVDTMKNNGYGAFMSKDYFREHFGLKYERNALIIKDPNTSPLQLRENVFGQFGERLEEMWGPEDWVSVVSWQYTGAYSIINFLIILSIIVSGIGITNTLLINIMERIRELGMMRAVGVTRKQVVKMIRLEGLGLGLAAAVIGCIVGVVLIYITTTFIQINSLTFKFEVSWAILLACGLFGIVVSWISSLSPASKASKTPLTEALRYE
ncbi:FtsX-like permease family protein [Paenibacillus thermotolerans]|uniref:FtsX-like permease family protein n=1 Tax=Paenibacillus thermotolerans TaxID=3027807 RepID=UPI002367860F|nr:MULTISPECIES: FtsX-like permease family protein [unclassified Paenibacillus]